MNKTNNTAIDAVHTHTWKDGTVVTTTWHDTKEAAEQWARKQPNGGRVHDERKRGAILGNFRAVAHSK